MSRKGKGGSQLRTGFQHQGSSCPPVQRSSNRREGSRLMRVKKDAIRHDNIQSQIRYSEEKKERDAVEREGIATRVGQE